MRWIGWFIEKKEGVGVGMWGKLNDCLKIGIAQVGACFKCLRVSEEQKTTAMLSQTPSITLQIKAETWSKQSHFLFDYESDRIFESNITVPIPSAPLNLYMKCEVITLSQERFTLIALEDGQKPTRQSTNIIKYQFIARIEVKGKDRGNVQVNFLKGRRNEQNGQNNSELQVCIDDERPYRIVNSLRKLPARQKGERLQVGQTIKLGRARLFVREISIGNRFQTSKTLLFPNRKTLSYIHHIIQPQETCKICLDKQQAIQDQLISPCKCSGSCKWVHLHCLNQWMNSKIERLTHHNTIQYNIDMLQCQICTEILPIRVEQQNGVILTAFDIKTPQGDYVILERMDIGMSLFVIVGNQRATIGRSYNENIVIQQITVSRSHASIELKDSDFYLYDQNAKFGTLITEENLRVEVGETSDAIQIGRNKLQFKLIDPSTTKNTLPRNQLQEYYSISSTQ